jgi:ribosomal protein L11 methyltransferase
MCHTTRFTRLTITVPRLIADAFAAALIELGAGAIEERETCDSVARGPLESGGGEASEVELVLTLTEDSSVGRWELLIRDLYRAFAEQLRLSRQALRILVEPCELDYHAGWLERLTPQQLTDEITFVPTHCAHTQTAERKLLYFEPHPSFGDGSHPTTRLAARAVERACRRCPGLSVLDVGTGNGVLCLVAAVSGATRAYGIDLDPQAVASARHNATLNRLDSICRFDDTALEAIAERFTLVVANLEPRSQDELLDQMAARVARGGTLILTGFLAPQASLISEPLPGLGFRLGDADAAEGYVLQVWHAEAEHG